MVESSKIFIPSRETIFPSFVPEYNREDICSAFISAVESGQVSQFADDVAAYCEDERTGVQMGYGVYPRFFDEGEGYYGRPADLRFGRIGKVNSSKFIRTNKDDLGFPNGALMYVLAQDMNKTGAAYMLVAGEEPELIISSTIYNSAEIPSDHAEK